MKRIIATLLLSTLCGIVQAHPPALDSEDYAIMHDFVQWVREQHNTDQQWCCDIADGRPIKPDEIRIADDPIHGRHYQILYTKKHWPEGTEEWVDVPKSSILNTMSPVGYPVVWMWRGEVRCFADAGAV